MSILSGGKTQPLIGPLCPSGTRGLASRVTGHDVSGVGSSSLGTEVGSRREAQNPGFGLTSRELETVLSLFPHQ